VRDLVDVPSPIVSATLPACAGDCHEIVQADVVCVTAPAVNDCFCSVLSWPTACADACQDSQDCSAVARWYWAICPSVMDSRLGQYSISRAVSSLAMTLDTWAVPTPDTGAVRTGYDCYFSEQCGQMVSTVSSAPSPTISSPNPSSPTSQSKSLTSKSNSNVLKAVIATLVVSLAFAIVMIVFFIRRSRRRRRQGRRRRDDSNESFELILGALMDMSVNQQNGLQGLEALAGAVRNTNRQMQDVRADVGDLRALIQRMGNRLGQEVQDQDPTNLNSNLKRPWARNWHVQSVTKYSIIRLA
jgi:hypothetical protein